LRLLDLGGSTNSARRNLPSAFSAGGLMMVSLLLRLNSSGILNEFPDLGLHPPEGFGVSTLGPHAGDLVERIEQPLPLSHATSPSAARNPGGVSAVSTSPVLACPCFVLHLSKLGSQR
jgi:hypothetical protein